jgi:hypothetical protein
MIKMQLPVRLVLVGLAIAVMLALASCSGGSLTYTPPTTPGSTSATAPAASPALTPDAAPWPVTKWHYAPNNNFNHAGEYTPGVDGFNLADVNAYSRSQLDGLPAGVHGLVYIGTCDGVTTAFQAAVDLFAGDPKLFGFYITDEPTPKHCPAANLLAEDNYIHEHAPGAKTFAILENLGKSALPTFTGCVHAAGLRARPHWHRPVPGANRSAWHAALRDDRPVRARGRGLGLAGVLDRPRVPGVRPQLPR